jgi:hypothetical protein
MTESQQKAAIFVALSTVTLIALWLIAVTILSWLQLLDARSGLGWTLAAAISTSAQMKLMFSVVATIVVAGLAAAGAMRRPGRFTYAAGALVVLGLLASVFLLWLMSDQNFASPIRGTTGFQNIKAGVAFGEAASGFSKSMAAALGTALAALLGISLHKAKTDG